MLFYVLTGDYKTYLTLKFSQIELHFQFWLNFASKKVDSEAKAPIEYLQLKWMVLDFIMTMQSRVMTLNLSKVHSEEYQTK